MYYPHNILLWERKYNKINIFRLEHKLLKRERGASSRGRQTTSSEAEITKKRPENNIVGDGLFVHACVYTQFKCLNVYSCVLLLSEVNKWKPGPDWNPNSNHGCRNCTVNTVYYCMYTQLFSQWNSKQKRGVRSRLRGESLNWVGRASDINCLLPVDLSKHLHPRS